MNLLLLVLLAIGVGVAVTVRRRYVARERRRILALFAASEGLLFNPGRDRGFVREYFFFDCLQQGYSHYAYNILSGELAGLTMTGFDYRYVSGGENKKVYRFSAVLVASPRPLRPLLVRPPTVLDRIGAFVGLGGIDFESAEFSGRFFVKAANPRWAHDVFHPRMKEFFLAEPHFSLQLDRDAIIAWRDSCFSPEDFRQACLFVRGFLERLPDYPGHDLGSGTPQHGPDAGTTS
jgi:hypothetical protein